MLSTSSRAPVRLGSQRPRVASVPESVTSSGPDAVALAASARLGLDDWQQWVLQCGLGEQADGRWSASECGLWVPRQNGKGGVIEAVVLAHLFLFGSRLIVWSAHEYRTAEQGFRRLQQLIEESPHLEKRVQAIREANGEQRVELPDGRRVQFNTRSKRALRGFTGDLLILDEAQELTEAQMAAILPTISARSAGVPGPQVWYFGTPPDDPAAWVYEVREAGERGDPGLFWADWGADLQPDEVTGNYDDAALDDDDLAYATNPALGLVRANGSGITLQAVHRERRRLQQSFARERLGVWLPRQRPGSGVIPADLWDELAVTDRERPPVVAFGVDVNASRTRASIAWAGLDPAAEGAGEVLVGIVDHRAGTQWVAERLAVLRDRWDPIAVAVDVRGPAATLEDDLEREGFARPDGEPRRGDLAVPTTSEVAIGYGRFVDAARQRRLRHVGDAPLTAAVQSARTRPLAGGTAWERKTPPGSVDVTPLTAATLALWALQERASADAAAYDVLTSIY